MVGLASSVPVPGRALLGALQQMKNRGNGKGGGIAVVGLDPGFFGVSPQLLAEDYLIAVAYLDPAAEPDVKELLAPFEIDHVHRMVAADPTRLALETDVRPPEVACYFVRVPPESRGEFMFEHGIPYEHRQAAEDEMIYQTSYRLNREFYAEGQERAFVLSHGKNLLVLKLVGFGDDVIRHYRLEGLEAHVWIGHHRYPTKGRVWHPGGAHPFLGMHEALVHNGDFANYASMCSYLAQYHRYPLFQTDTEVAALLFDLLHRTHGYPLEYVIEAMAPTTERDFTLLPPDRQSIYRTLQAAHMHGSPDGPWFFLIAQSAVREGAFRLIGVTDTSMLRPQVFAVQQGEVSIGFAASEKQAIDAVLESLAAEDRRFWGRADRYWNARGGSHTDGGAFIFSLRPAASDRLVFSCVDKFGRSIEVDTSRPVFMAGTPANAPSLGMDLRRGEGSAPQVAAEAVASVATSTYEQLAELLAGLEHSADNDEGRALAIHVLTTMMDGRYPTGSLRRSVICSMLDRTLAGIVERIRKEPSAGYEWVEVGSRTEPPASADTIMVLDARHFSVQGPDSASRVIVDLCRRGAKRFLVANTRGHRFLGCGLGPESDGVTIDVYGAPGDYLGSGIDGASITVHGSAQDQVAQITKRGKLVIHGDVGQAFMYSAKGGRCYVLGNAAGRPLISAVGTCKVVINGTCLDYLAESFMAGDPLIKGGFAVVNGVLLDDDGQLRELNEPYPGANLLSLASGGAIYVRDPHGKLTDDQLNGGEYVSLTERDWQAILPLLQENEKLFGITIRQLLTVNGERREPWHVYRKVQPSAHHALMPEEAWVLRKNGVKKSV